MRKWPTRALSHSSETSRTSHHVSFTPSQPSVAPHHRPHHRQACYCALRSQVREPALDKETSGRTAESDFFEELAIVWWKVVCGILICSSLQQGINEYQRQEDEARQRIEDWIGVHRDPARISEQQMMALINAHPDTKLEMKMNVLIKKVARALTFQIRILLTYTQNPRSDCPLLAAHRATLATLATFSSDPEHEFSHGSWSDVEGEVVEGPLIVLNEDLDVEREVEERFASVVSLSPECHKESNGINFDEGEDKADAGREHREVEEEAEEDDEDAAAVADMNTTATVTTVKHAEDYDVDGEYETDSKFK